MPNGAANEGHWRVYLKIITLIGKAQRASHSKAEILDVYREALALTREWVPVVEAELRGHGLLGGDDGGGGMGESRVLAANMNGIGLRSLVAKVVKKGVLGLGKNGGGKWKAGLTKELHGTVVMFVEEAEREIERLERRFGRGGGRERGQAAAREHPVAGRSRDRRSRGVPSDAAPTGGPTKPGSFDPAAFGPGMPARTAGGPGNTQPFEPAAFGPGEPADADNVGGYRHSRPPSAKSARSRAAASRPVTVSQSTGGVPQDTASLPYPTEHAQHEYTAMPSGPNTFHDGESSRSRVTRAPTVSSIAPSQTTIRPVESPNRTAVPRAETGHQQLEQPDPAYEYSTGIGGARDARRSRRTSKSSRPSSSKTSRRTSAGHTGPHASGGIPSHDLPPSDMQSGVNEQQASLGVAGSHAGSKGSRMRSQASSSGRHSKPPDIPSTQPLPADMPPTDPSNRAFHNPSLPVMDPPTWQFPDPHQTPAPSERSAKKSHSRRSGTSAHTGRSRRPPSVAHSQAANSTRSHGSARGRDSAPGAASVNAVSPRAEQGVAENPEDLFSDVSSIDYLGFERRPRRKKCHHGSDDEIDPAYCDSVAGTNSSCPDPCEGFEGRPFHVEEQ